LGKPIPSTLLIKPENLTADHIGWAKKIKKQLKGDGDKMKLVERTWEDKKNGRIDIIDEFRLGSATYKKAFVVILNREIFYFKFLFHYDNYYYSGRGKSHHSIKATIEDNELKFSSGPDFVKEELTKKARKYYKALVRRNYLDY